MSTDSPHVTGVAGLRGRLIRLLGFDQSREAPEVPAKLTFRLGRLDVAALVFIAVLLAVLALRYDALRPRIDSDHDYHVAVARRILETRSIPLWDDWEYAPPGRPHLYPPALHLAIAAFALTPDRVTQGFQILQVLSYPAALLAFWWFARWLFGARMGLLALLLFSMDKFIVSLMTSARPGGIETALLPLILMCFLARRKLPAVLLLTLAFYVHLGLPLLVLLGLFIWSARTKGYLRFYWSVVGWTAVLFLPWIVHVACFAGWLGVPSLKMSTMAGPGAGKFVVRVLIGLLMVRGLNPVLVGVHFTGFFRFKHPAASLFKCLLIGFLPVLAPYEGRFWMHTAPIWAVFGASLFVRYLPETASALRIAALALVTLLPLPVFSLELPGRTLHVEQSVGGLRLALNVLVAPPPPDREFADLADFVRKNTAAREIVHVEPGRDYLGDRIVAATGRRVDVGGWMDEVRTRRMDDLVRAYRDADTDCLFVWESSEPPASLGCDRVVRVGKYAVGIRGKTKPLDEQSHPAEGPYQIR